VDHESSCNAGFPRNTGDNSNALRTFAEQPALPLGAGDFLIRSPPRMIAT
jgi:hypothetical protein